MPVTAMIILVYTKAAINTCDSAYEAERFWLILSSVNPPLAQNYTTDTNESDVQV